MLPAKKSDWQTIDFPPVFSELILDRTFSDDEYEKLQLGLVPAQMEDKWFIYLEDEALNFHRSWTGFAIYHAPLKRSDAGYTIQSFKVNRNREQYNCDNDEYDKAILSFLIDRLLLNKNVPFPGNNDIEPGKMPLYIHSIVGYGRSNQQ